MPTPEKKIVLASGNPGKLREFQTLLAHVGFDVFPQSHFKITAVEETGLTFVENAILKARHACEQTELPAIADDSGIEVDALNGQPGIYSARFSGSHASDSSNNEHLLQALRDIPDSQRSARYQCILVYMRHAKDPTPIICQGTWEGQILRQARGENGFGYDPLFYVPSHCCSSAELNKDIKNSISHRAIAMRKLLERLSCETQ